MAWNVFKFCTALRGLGSIMILLVLGVVGVTYYAVVLTNYGPAALSPQGGFDSLAALTILLLFHFLVSLKIPTLDVKLVFVVLSFLLAKECLFVNLMAAGDASLELLLSCVY